VRDWEDLLVIALFIVGITGSVAALILFGYAIGAGI
jgi:hypothetical protein